MRIPKRYGQSKVESCPFCKEQGTTLNPQGVPVCVKHKHHRLSLKCVCGQEVEIKTGRYGAFCLCPDCGAVNLRKILEMN